MSFLIQKPNNLSVQRKWFFFLQILYAKNSCCFRWAQLIGDQIKKKKKNRVMKRIRFTVKVSDANEANDGW